MYVWRIATLWPATEAIVGVYDHPPPDGSGIDYAIIDPTSPGFNDFTGAIGLRTARSLTRLKDWVRAHTP